MKATNEFVSKTSEEYEKLELKYIKKKQKVLQLFSIIKKQDQTIKALKKRLKSESDYS